MNEPTTEKGKDGTIKLTTIGDLLGKKSVRATFKLHPTIIELLSSLSAQLGIKQKSLFDYLMEDEDVLQAMAAAPSNTEAKDQRIQKTFVVSQRSLAALDTIAKHSPASRDDLIERSIQRLLPVLKKERLRQQRREESLDRIAKHFKQGNALLDSVKRMVGEEDTLYQSLLDVISLYSKAYMEMKRLVDKGKRISAFPIDSMKQDPQED